MIFFFGFLLKIFLEVSRDEALLLLSDLTIGKSFLVTLDFFFLFTIFFIEKFFLFFYFRELEKFFVNALRAF